jgi:hypothetical protein
MAFIKNEHYTNEFLNLSMDGNITVLVIENKVMRDTSLVGGRECSIDLIGLPVTENIDYTATIHIPHERTQGRNILQVFRIDYSSSNYNNTIGVGSVGGTQMDSRISDIIDASNTVPVSSTNRVDLIAPNTVLVELNGILPTYFRAQCLLEDSSELEHIRPKAYELFGDLCVEKTKQYIYNKLIIDIDRGIIERGFEVGIIKDIIDDYRDANENYKDLLKRWSKQSYLSDPQRLAKLIQIQIPKL